MEAPLPPTAPAPGPESPVSGSADGLATGLATKFGAGPGQAAGSAAPVGPGSSPGGARRGRPPVHGLYSKAAGSDGHRPAVLPGPDQVGAAQVEIPGDTRVSIPEDVLSSLVVETLGAGEEFASLKLLQIAGKAGLTPGEIGPQLERARLGDRRKGIIADLVPYALQEWGLDPQISPTAAIGLVLGPWAFASVSAYFTLAGLAAEKMARDKLREKHQTNREGAP
jgi:hypothetical protein